VLDGRGKGGHISCRHKEPVVAGADDVGGAVRDVVRDRKASVGHRLDEDQWKPLAAGCEKKERRVGELLARIRMVAVEGDAGLGVRRASRAFDLRSGRPVPEDVERNRLAYRRDGSDRVVYAFSRVE
jgi:hypothetical protein